VRFPFAFFGDFERYRDVTPFESRPVQANLKKPLFRRTRLCGFSRTMIGG